MRKDSERKLLALGFDTILIQKIDSKSLTITGLKGQNKNALIKNGFTHDEADLIIGKVNRTDIPDEVLKNILRKSGEVCCYCIDGNSAKPFQIHHMEEYHVKQNNSEENLVLICPTHHVVIHANKISIEEQKFKKLAWQNLWQISENYKKYGQIFPFGAFELQDYTTPSSLTEIFSFRAPKGSVCIKLSNGTIASEAIEILKKENKLVLTGNSGSGKTTMAVGIAGQFKDYDIYKYIIGGKDSIEATQEIFLFLSYSIKNIIIIIDDANTRLQPEQIEKILSVANKNKRVVIVNTRNSFKNDDFIEQHFLNCIHYIDWTKMQEHVKEVLNSNEEEIINYLNKEGINDFDGQKIGYTFFEHRLKYLLDRFSKSTNTVWELIFLLGGGLSRIESKYYELRSFDGFDIVLLYLSITQIAKVENGLSVEDILLFYRRNSILNKLSPPDSAWLEKKLNELCESRVLKLERGRYKTIHRQYAKNFIEVAYLRDVKGCEEVLSEIFEDRRNIKEIVILWSWLRLTSVNKYIANWYRSLSLEQWKELADNAVNDGLQTISFLAEHMHLIAHGQDNKIINEVFKDKADILAELINQSKDDSALYYFQDLAVTLKYHCREIFKSLLDKIDQDNLAKIIRNAEPDSFSKLESLFNSIYEAYPEWAVKFSEKFTMADFKKITEKCKKGKVDRLYDIVSFQRRYCMNISRSQFKYYTEKIGELMKGCSLEEIHFPTIFFKGLLELIHYDQDIQNILNNLDTTKLATEYVETNPGQWGALLSLSMLSKYSSSKQIENFVDKLDEEKLKVSIEKFFLGNLHEFRLLIHQLNYGNQVKRNSLALMLKPFIEEVYKKHTDPANNNDILEAYNRLDNVMAKEIAIKFNRSVPPEIKEPDPKDAHNEDVEKAEASGADYQLYDTKIK
ncbi:MAG: hypothetical protein IM600_18345 [Bacteroidetes bacterium]|nr:hypothetical protein [Bacteroidota bacterium]MCA6445393.1 hypothetical protein [Bacteroidota bacterium]